MPTDITLFFTTFETPCVPEPWALLENQAIRAIEINSKILRNECWRDISKAREDGLTVAIRSRLGIYQPNQSKRPVFSPPNHVLGSARLMLVVPLDMLTSVYSNTVPSCIFNLMRTLDRRLIDFLRNASSGGLAY